MSLVASCAGAIWYSGIEPSPEDELQLAEFALAHDDLDAAFEHLERVAEAAPAAANMPERLVELAIRRESLDDAEKWIDRIPPQEAARRSGLQFVTAQAAMQLADATRVERLLQEVVRYNPRQPAARQMLVKLYMLLQRQSDLRQQVSEMDRLNPERRPDTNILLIFCIGTRARWQDKTPREWLERAHQRDPGNNSVRGALAETLLQADERDQAHELIAHCPTTGADRWRVSLVQVDELLEMAENGQAEQLLKELDPAAQADSRFWLARGRIAFNAADKKLARTCFQQAAELDPFDPRPVHRLAYLTCREGSEKIAHELAQHAAMQVQLYLVAKRALSNPQERKAVLQETASLLEQLKLSRLSLLLYTALAGDFPEYTEAREKISDLRVNPAALRPLFHAASQAASILLAPK